MPDPDYGKITDDRVAALRERLGLDLEPENRLPVSGEERARWRPRSTGFNVEVSIDTSRHFVNGYGDTNPLYCDPEYAAKTRWDTLIAAPTMFWTFAGDLEPTGSLRPEIAKKMKGDPLRGVGSLQADVLYDFYRPMKRGDRIYRKDAKTGIADKRSSWGGRAVHETTSFVSYNQDKEVVTLMRGRKTDMTCLNKLASFLLYALIIDFSLEMLDFIHRLYESEESIEILSRLISSKLFISLTIVQMLLGTIGPMLLLAGARFSRLPDELKRLSYFIAALFVQVGIFSIRWNVVIGGQLFSKSFRGLTVYKMELVGEEGLLTAIGFLILPFLILYVLVKILPPWLDSKAAEA